jgi:hypothetical protein
VRLRLRHARHYAAGREWARRAGWRPTALTLNICPRSGSWSLARMDSGWCGHRSTARAATGCGRDTLSWGRSPVHAAGIRCGAASAARSPTGRRSMRTVHALHLLGPFPALIVEVETKRSDALRRDRHLVPRSGQGVCAFVPIIIADPTSALRVGAPFVTARVATNRFWMRSTSKDQQTARRRYQAGAVGSTPEVASQYRLSGGSRRNPV